MSRAKYIVIAAVIAITAGTVLALNEPGDFILVNNNTAIQRLGAMQPFVTVDMMPDTAPPYYPHPQALRFRNERFHLLTQSPVGDLLAFSAGEEDQWIGVMNLKERYMKFVAWGMKTAFLDLTFSPDGKHLAYAYYGPDHRTKIQIVETPVRETAKPVGTNIWFQSFKHGEQFRPLGWILPGDTTFSFTILDSLGNELKRVDLPLHIDYDNLPEEMQKERKMPEGTFKTD